MGKDRQPAILGGDEDPVKLLAGIGVTKYPARWEPMLARETQLAKQQGCPAVEEGFLQELNARYHLFEQCFPQVLAAAAQIRASIPLLLFIRLLCATAECRQSMEEDMPSLAFPCAPEGIPPLGYDMAPLFAVLFTVPESYRKYRARGVDEEMLRATFRSYESGVLKTQIRTGRIGFASGYFSWARLYIAAQILHIGRLEFEMKEFPSPIRVFRRGDGAVRALMDGMKLHSSGRALGMEGFCEEAGSYQADLREEEGFWEGYPVLEDARAGLDTIKLRKDEWQEVLRKGDSVLSVHIPAGPGLTREACEQTYAQAQDLFRRLYPDFPFRAFVCYSWLMDPKLAQLLKPDSNIVAFQSQYTRFPTVGDTKGVFTFVFQRPFDKLEDLPENTSLERALKAHYLSGNKIYSTGGYFLREDCD